MPNLFTPPHAYIPSGSGLPQAGLLAYFFITNTSTPKDTFADYALTVPNENPVVADANGVWPVIYMAQDVNYRVTIKTALGVTVYTQDGVPGPVLDGPAMTAVEIGTALFPITAAETSSGVAIADYTHEPGNVLRYGILPNNASLATANTTALTTLLLPTSTGIVGDLVWPNTTGTDTYYFNNLMQVRSGVHMDLNDCTLNFAKTYASGDDTFGWFTFIQDVTIENGSIVVNYNGGAGSNAGSIFRIGSRYGYGFGSDTGGIDEEDLTTPMGGIVLRNLRLSTNNPQTAILMLGGFDGVVMENITLDCQSLATAGIYYEFGFWHHEATAANIKSAHALNMSFKNVSIKNVNGGAFSLVGALAASVDGLHIDGCINGFVGRSGEALYYNKGTPFLSQKPHLNLRNINVLNDTGTGFNLQGAESASGGYLSAIISGLGHPGDYVAQTDLISFNLDGFNGSSAAVGMKVSGACALSNGSLVGGASSGQLVVTDECMRFALKNVRILNSSSVGIRANFGTAIWSPARLKTGTIDTCLIAGNTGPGLSVQNCVSVRVSNTRFGYSTAYDVAAETTQTNAISVSATGGAGVVANGCNVSTSGGAVAYTNAGTGSNGCGVTNPRGTVTFTGTWEIDGMTFASATNIADKTNAVNTADKYLGRRCYDTSNHRVMVAQGATDVSTWIVADASATVTPS